MAAGLCVLTRLVWFAPNDFTVFGQNLDGQQKFLSAVLNSPLVSAFIASREGNRDIRKTTLEDCPIPSLAPSDMATLERYVDDLTAALSEQPESKLPLWRLVWGGDSWEERARNILLQIDALVLRAYNLPPWIERKLLEIFSWRKSVQCNLSSVIIIQKDYGPDFAFMALRLFQF